MLQTRMFADSSVVVYEINISVITVMHC